MLDTTVCRKPHEEGRTSLCVSTRANAFITATDRIGAKRDFYSASAKPGTQELDDKITAYETTLAPMLQELRDRAGTGAVQSAIAAEVVVHLTVRGAFIRDWFATAAEEIIEHIGSIFSAVETSRQVLGIDEVMPKGILLDEIAVCFDKLPSEITAKLPKPLFMRIGLAWIRESYQDLHAAQISEISSVLKNMHQNIGQFAQSGHAKALEPQLAPDKRVADLCTFTWTVELFDRHSLVLPDCVAIAELADGSFGALVTQDANEVARILVPLSDACLLLGKRGSAHYDTLDASEFNRVAATSSWDFFVASHRSAQLETFAATIRDDSQKRLSDLIKEAASSYIPGSAGGTTPLDGGHKLPEFLVSLRDYGDREHAENLANVVSSVAQAVCSQVPLNRLESVTFADDYVAALKYLDRGREDLHPLVPTDDACGTGVAMAPIVIRRGQIRMCVVAQSWLSDALVDATHDGHATALHVLVGTLARVAFVELMDTTFPGVLLHPLPDAWNRYLYQHAEGICSAYFSARFSAPIAPEFGADLVTLFCTTLQRANIEIPQARLAYRSHANLNEFLETVRMMLNPVLERCASLIGHLDGLDETPFDDEGRLAELLQSSDLGRWFEIYSRDLRKHYERAGVWSSFNEFLFLNVHVERHLWRFGIFPWRSEDGFMRVEVPLVTDAEALGLVN
jgi:hypothetical protein